MDVNKTPRSNPRFYNGTRSTAHQIRDLLPHLLAKIQVRQNDRPDAILAAWPSIVGVNIAPMTRAGSFVDGVLTVYVKNSTLLSLLSQHEKPRVLKRLRETFRHTKIYNIVFKIG